MHTTLNKIRDRHPCEDGWIRLLHHLGKTKADDEPLSLLTILESNHLDDALWCLRAVEGYDKEKRLFAVWCARQVQHLMTDPRSVAALNVVERYAHGEATLDELIEAESAASAASRAAASAASRAATEAATGAEAAAEAAARAAARTAAEAATGAAEWSATGYAIYAVSGYVYGSEARVAAWAAAWDSARKAQEGKFRELFGVY